MTVIKGQYFGNAGELKIVKKAIWLFQLKEPPKHKLSEINLPKSNICWLAHNTDCSEVVLQDIAYETLLVRISF